MNMHHPGSIDPRARVTSSMQKETQSAPALQLQHDSLSSFFGNMAQTLPQPETQYSSSYVAGPSHGKGKQPDNSPSNADGPGLEHTRSGDGGGNEEIN